MTVQLHTWSRCVNLRHKMIDKGRDSIRLDRMFVKICGLKTVDDVAAVEAAGADAMGVVLSNTSPRAVSVERARELVGASSNLTTVLVVHDLSIADVIAAANETGVDVVQLHGYSEADTRRALAAGCRIWRATSVTAGPVEVGAYGEEALLLDSHRPGSGTTWDLSALGEPPAGRWLLAGGLTPDNVATAIAAAQPWGVDVSSGVEESRGVKNHDLIDRFVAAARG